MDGSVIQSIMDALPKIKREDVELDRKAGVDRSNGIDLMDEGAWKRAFMQNRHEEQLEADLLRCDSEELLKTEVLMYYGRDQNDVTFAEKMAYFRRLKESKCEIARTLLSKRDAFPTYIAKAKKKLEFEGLSIGSL